MIDGWNWLWRVVLGRKWGTGEVILRGKYEKINKKYRFSGFLSVLFGRSRKFV